MGCREREYIVVAVDIKQALRPLPNSSEVMKAWSQAEVKPLNFFD
jgi:hypothetical protein